MRSCKTASKMALARLAILLFVISAWLLGEQSLAKKSSKKSCSSDFFNQYHSASDISAFVEACAEKYGAKIAQIGKSAEHRPLKVVTVGNGENEVFVMAGLHGREWIAPAATAWAMYEVMRRGTESGDPMNSFLTKNKVHFLVLINPDGYDFTRTKSETQDRRQWRKNRRLLPCKGDRCAHGVDLNRNWGIEGRTFGFGATRPTSDVYQGKRPFSEPEILAIRDWLLEHGRGKHIEFVLDVHCCAQTVLPPSYYHDEAEELKAEHLGIARKVAKAMTSVNQEQYGFREREKEFSATNSGISVDWIYGEGGVGLALIVETRGNEKNRKLENIFDVDTKNIAPIGGEVLAAIVAVSEEKLSNRAKSASRVSDTVPSASIASKSREHPEKDIEGEMDVKREESGFGANKQSIQISTSNTHGTDIAKVNENLISFQSDTSESALEEPLPEPLFIEPLISPRNDDSDPPPPAEPSDEAPPPPPGIDEESPIEDSSKSAAYRRRHRLIDDMPSNSGKEDQSSSEDLSLKRQKRESFSMQDDISRPAENERFVASDESETNDDESHVESFHPKQGKYLVQDDSQDQEAEEDADKSEKEVDEELDEILSEVVIVPRSEKGNEIFEENAGQKAGIDKAKMIRHDHDLVIMVEEADDEDADDSEEHLEETLLKHMAENGDLDSNGADEEFSTISEGDDTEMITKRLRSRINQLRAIRELHPVSKWQVLKAKVKRGKWRAPLAMLFFLLIVWQIATKKNRVRRDD